MKNLKKLTVLSALAVTVLSCAKVETPASSSDRSLQSVGNAEAQIGLTATSYTPGTSYKYYVSNSSSSYLAIEYIAGDANSRLILLAPHGGLSKPAIMKTRTEDYDYGTLPSDPYSDDTSFSDIADSKTKEMALSIADSVRILTGVRPHVIINHIHRSKLDGNRRREVATQGGIYAGPAWDKFHEYIDDAKATILSNHESGLLIDVHGQAHTPQRTELGYLLTKNQLTTYSSTLGNLVNYSSIKAMVEPGITHTSLIKGTNALGTLLNNRLGYKVTPSQAYPQPGDASIFTDGKYFNGGYNTSRHGSKFGGTISAIQIEFNQGVRLTDSTRPAYAGKTARAVIDYMGVYFN
jgi:hypothetical protein